MKTVIEVIVLIAIIGVMVFGFLNREKVLCIKRNLTEDIEWQVDNDGICNPVK